MIYLSKNNRTKVVTDNVSSFFPNKFDVYLDDNLLGEFDNLSTSKQYIIFDIPKLDLLEEKEYMLKLVYHQATIKEELCIVKDLYEQQIKSIDNNSKNIKMYEK